MALLLALLWAPCHSMTSARKERGKERIRERMESKAKAASVTIPSPPTLCGVWIGISVTAAKC